MNADPLAVSPLGCVLRIDSQIEDVCRYLSALGRPVSPEQVAINAADGSFAVAIPNERVLAFGDFDPTSRSPRLLREMNGFHSIARAAFNAEGTHIAITDAFGETHEYLNFLDAAGTMLRGMTALAGPVAANQAELAPPEQRELYLARMKLLTDLMRERDLDGVVVYAEGGRKTNPHHMWLTGVRCTTEDGLLLCISREGVARFIDVSWGVKALQRKLAARGLDDIPIDSKDSAESLRASIHDIGAQWKRIGYVGTLPCDMCSGDLSRYVPLTELDQYMSVKTEAELQTMRRAAREITWIVEYALSAVKIGMTEQDVAALIENGIRAHHARMCVDEVRVISGETLPATTGRPDASRMIQEGTIICVDIGHVVDEMFSDITRMKFIGENPARGEYELLKLATGKAIEQLLPGMSVCEFTHLIAAQIDRMTLPGSSMAVSELGHAIGLSLHEPPFLSMEGHLDTRFAENMVVCVEPDITTGHSAIRIEEMVQITSKGGRIISRI